MVSFLPPKIAQYCFGEENSLSLSEFWGRLGEFCEKLGEFVLAVTNFGALETLVLKAFRSLKNGLD